MSSLAMLTLFLDCSVLGMYSLSASNYFALNTIMNTTITVSKRPCLSVPTTVLSNITSNFVATVLRAGVNIGDLLSNVVIGATLCSIGVNIVKNSSVLGVGGARAIFAETGSVLDNKVLNDRCGLFIVIVTILTVTIVLNLFLHAHLNLTVQTANGGPSVIHSSSVGPTFAAVIKLYITGDFATLSNYLLTRSRGSMGVSVNSNVMAVTLTSLLVNGIFVNEQGVPLHVFNVIVNTFMFELICAITLHFGVPTFVLGLMSSIVIITTVSVPCLGRRLPLCGHGLTRHGKEETT